MPKTRSLRTKVKSELTARSVREEAASEAVGEPKVTYAVLVEKVTTARAAWTKASEDLAVAEAELEALADCDADGIYTGRLKADVP